MESVPGLCSEFSFPLRRLSDLCVSVENIDLHTHRGDAEIAEEAQRISNQNPKQPGRYRSRF